jgi:hypothetical protein
MVCWSSPLIPPDSIPIEFSLTWLCPNRLISTKSSRGPYLVPSWVQPKGGLGRRCSGHVCPVLPLPSHQCWLSLFMEQFCEGEDLPLSLCPLRPRGAKWSMLLLVLGPITILGWFAQPCWHYGNIYSFYSPWITKFGTPFPALFLVKKTHGQVEQTFISMDVDFSPHSNYLNQIWSVLFYR